MWQCKWTCFMYVSTTLYSIQHPQYKSTWYNVLIQHTGNQYSQLICLFFHPINSSLDMHACKNNKVLICNLSLSVSSRLCQLLMICITALLLPVFNNVLWSRAPFSAYSLEYSRKADCLLFLFWFDLFHFFIYIINIIIKIIWNLQVFF